MRHGIGGEFISNKLAFSDRLLLEALFFQKAADKSSNLRYRLQVWSEFFVPNGLQVSCSIGNSDSRI